MGNGFCLKYTIPAISSVTQIVVQSLPVFSLTTSGALAECQGNILTLSSTQVTGNTWSTGATSQSINVTTSGAYTLTVTGNNGCSADTTVNAIFNSCVPATSLRPQDCSNQNLTLNSFILCSQVIGATAYNWEISDASGNTVLNTTTTSSYYEFINHLLPNVQFNTQYKIRVRAFINNLFSDFSNPCTVGLICDPTICGVPTTQIRTVDCNKFTYTIATGRIIADYIQVTNQWEFEFRDVTTNTVVATKMQSLNTLFLNTVTGLVPGTYNVAVRARRGTIWGSFGPTCPIGIVSNVRYEDSPSNEEFVLDENGQVIDVAEQLNMIELLVLPNPFTTEATAIVKSTESQLINLSIRDVAGRLINHFDVQSNELFSIGNGLEAGVYLVDAADKNGTHKLFKVVKQQ